MPPGHSRIVIKKTGLLRRPSIQRLPASLQRQTHGHALHRKKKAHTSMPDASLSVEIKTLRELPRDSKEYRGLLRQAKQTIAGQLALTAKTDTTLHHFLVGNKNHYLFINSQGRPVLSRTKKGRFPRMAIQDVLWLMSHL